MVLESRVVVRERRWKGKRMEMGRGKRRKRFKGRKGKAQKVKKRKVNDGLN